MSAPPTARSILRHVSLLVMALGLLGLGSMLVARSDGRLVQSVGAESLGYVQIAPAQGGDFTTELGPVWVLENGAPGDTTFGAIRVRTVDVPNPANTSLRISADIAASLEGTSLADNLLIDGIFMGSVNLLQYWDESCRPNGQLSFAMLESCESPRLPMPPGGEGALLSIGLTVNPAAGNELQGLSTGLVSFLFTLEDATPDGPGPDPEPEEPGPQEPETGTIVAIVESPSPVPASAYTLSIDGPTGVTGPGPQQIADVPVNDARLVSAVAPAGWTSGAATYDITIADTACVSDDRGDLNVAVDWAVSVTPAAGDEIISCTFTIAVEIVDDGTPDPGTGATPTPQPGTSPTPGAPSTGTGSSASDSVGVGLLAVGGALAALWLTSAGLSLAAVRRRRSSE